jgi:Diacylglycerol kinase
MNKNYLVGRKKSIEFAFKGIYALIKSEPNAQIHLFASILAILSGLFLNISNTEWCLIIFAIAFVWTAEALNTTIEKIVDHFFPEFDEKARYLKDVSAGAVLISSIAALITGIIIFVPKLF